MTKFEHCIVVTRPDHGVKKELVVVLAAERQRCAALEAAQKDLEAACQEALDEAKISNDALNAAKTDLELCKLDLEAAQLEIDERAHAEETKGAQLEAQLRDAQPSATRGRSRSWQHNATRSRRASRSSSGS